MVNDPELEREDVGGGEPMGDPPETEPQVTREDEELEAPDFALEKRPDS